MSCKKIGKLLTWLFLALPVVMHAQGVANFGIVTQSTTLNVPIQNNTPTDWNRTSTKSSGPFNVNFPSNVAHSSTVQVPVSFNASGATPGTYTGSAQATYKDVRSTKTMTMTVNSTATFGVPGSIFPKYQVLSVIYAPPGAQSFANYGTTTELGTSNSWENSFDKSTTLAVEFSKTTGFKVGVFKGGVTTTVGSSQTWGEQVDNTSSISVDKSNSLSVQIPGPLNSNIGIDHDADIVMVWLNPESDFMVTGASSAVWEHAFDPRDIGPNGIPINDVDKVPLTVGQLKDPTKILDPDILARLQRTWAGSGQGLTNADLLSIAKSDPFWNLGTTPPSSIDPTRFDVESGETIPFVPPQCGFGPLTTSGKFTYKTTAMQGQSATDTYKVGWSVSRSANVSFMDFLSAHFTVTASQDLTWVNKWGHDMTASQAQDATWSVTGPTDCHYSGFTNMQVYKDNVYGTFMFAFF